MIIQIAPLAALLVLVGIAVSAAVFRHTARTHGPGGHGDLGTSIGAGAAVVAVLAVLLTPGFGRLADAPGAPAPSAPGVSADR